MGQSPSHKQICAYQKRQCEHFYGLFWPPLQEPQIVGLRDDSYTVVDNNVNKICMISITILTCII